MYPEDIKSMISLLIDEIENNTLSLPTLPDVALRIRDILEDEDASFSDICNTIKTDPALAAKILQIANSPLTCPSKPVGTLEGAVSRIGLNIIGNLAVSLLSGQLFCSEHPGVHERLVEIWRHSLNTAKTAQELSSEANFRISGEIAYTAGLIHDIGHLPILLQVESLYPDKVGEPWVLDVSMRYHERVGMRLLEKWRFPETLAKVACHHEAVSAEESESPLVDIVAVADLLNAAPFEVQDREFPEIGETAAAKRIGLQISVSG